MPTTHCLPDKVAMAYAAGTLPEALSIVVASHLSMCDESRASVEGFDAVGGALLNSIEPVRLESDDNLLISTLALIRGGPIREQPAPKESESLLPIPLQEYVGTDIAAVPWKSVGLGVEQVVVKTCGPATVRLLKVPAGVAVPEHGHEGLEMTLVLQGALIDHPSTLQRGDISIVDQHCTHLPIADISSNCICLTATEGALRFKSLSSKLAQVFRRI
ncbi:MAG: ChrR family anti-sigma-E factor [Aestuariivita sp.]|nr:ChrR family anti-sigma-E factor [Aestuariivita sp.]